MTDTKKHLTRLEAVGLIRLAQTHPELEFMFRHALIRDAAYKSLLREDRKKIHRQVAEAIEQSYPDQLDEHAADLARHYTEAGLNEQAIPYWQQAGDYAKQRSANAEAIKHFSNGLKLLETLPDTSERTSQELALQIGLGSVLMAVKGYATPEVEKTYARAKELCQQVGETPHLFPVLYGLWGYYFVRGQLQRARELANQFLILTQHQQDPAFRLVAHRILGTNLFFLGEMNSAREHLDKSIALYNPQKHRSLKFIVGQDPGVSGLSLISLVLLWLGYPDQALKRSHEAIALAQETSHPLSMAFALDIAAIFHQVRREEQVTRERAAAAVALSVRQGFSQLSTNGVVLQGWLLTKGGDTDEGIAQILQGLDSYRAIGGEVWRPYLLTQLARAYETAGKTEEALVTLDDALTEVYEKEEVMWVAELYRLKGELLLADESEIFGNRLSPEDNFQKAIEVARSQQAKSLELRATVSLSRLWQSQGKQVEARQVLAKICNWFTEGFDTVDLQEAKALLEELS